VFGSVQSPMQSQPSTRTLPSPPGIQYPRTGSSEYTQYSPTTTQAAHATHLQDLQHQISTKTLALQTLQREHDQLLAAFSRSQIRCTALDKKSQVSDHEINSLTEDRIRLQQQVEAMEAQIQDLMRSRDEFNQQSSADGAQWRQIVAMSSQLQLKGADDARRFRLERETWERERASLHKRIEELESEKKSSGFGAGVSSWS
jgi:chromosome segregation ATPase